MTARQQTGIRTWNELVHGPTGRNLAAPARTHERRQQLGQVVTLTPASIKVPQGDGRRRERRITRRANGVMGATHKYRHFPRTRGHLTAQARANMARIRAHQPTTFDVQ